jgi:hypothetical protein
MCNVYKQFFRNYESKIKMLYAISASGVGSAVHKWCNNIEIISFVTPPQHAVQNSSARHVTTHIVVIPMTHFSLSEQSCIPVLSLQKVTLSLGEVIEEA